MLAQEYYQLNQSVRNQNTIFSFSGYVSERLLFSLGEILKQKLALEETNLNTAKKVFSIFVEQVQNIIRYSDEKVSGEANSQKIEISSGVISVGVENERFFVVCGNLVRRQDVPELQSRLELIRSLDKEGIKAYYKEKMKEPMAEDSKGASLGLAEIARRSSLPIEFEFVEVDEQKDFFCLKAYI